MLGQSNQPPPGVEQHRAQSPRSVSCAVVTVSDTRTIQTDRSGTLMSEMLEAHGHRIADRVLVPDEPERIREAIVAYRDRGDVQAVLLTGGTGISPRDQTFETVNQLLTRALPGYGELFRALSYEEIGAAAMLSRATGGLLGQMIVLTMPGSAAAVRLAMDKLILPELGHLVSEATKEGGGG